MSNSEQANSSHSQSPSTPSLAQILFNEPRRALQTWALERQGRSDPSWKLNYKLRTPASIPAVPSKRVQEFKNGKRLILACDGGGIFGIVTLQCLKALEQALDDTPVFEIFDMFAGTSTGAIIASSLAAGISVDDLITLYRDKRAEIFAPTFFHSGLFRKLGKLNLFVPKYSKQPIRGMLQSVFGDMPLAQVPRDLLITAKDTVRGETVFFTAFHDLADRADPKTWKEKAHGTYRQVLLRSAVEASMSAPTYFKPLGRFVDGGVGTFKNTCYVAAVEALRYSKNQNGKNLYDEGKVAVYSFGTGASFDRQPADTAQKHGLLDWVHYVIGIGMQDANKQQVDIAARELCDTEHAIEFRRYQFYFSDEGLAKIQVAKPSELDRYGSLELDSIEWFAFINDVGKKFGEYLRTNNLFTSPKHKLI